MSKISYNSLTIDGLKDVLMQVNTACKQLQIDWFIVGAVAKNIWYAQNDEKIHGTKDIDFGIYVPDVNKYNQLRKKLIKEYTWHISSNNEFCFITPSGKEVDLLPFGEIENNNTVMIEGKGLTSINLDGFKEAFEIGIKQVQIGNENYRICSIPAIVVLKLIAFDDRPEQRIKDVKDINSICIHYPNIENEMIWAEYFKMYNDNNEHNDVAMIALGSEINKIIKGNPDLKNRIINIIDKAINQKSDFMRYMIEDTETETLEMKVIILKNIKQGIINERS